MDLCTVLCSPTDEAFASFPGGNRLKVSNDISALTRILHIMVPESMSSDVLLNRPSHRKAALYQ